VPIIVAMTIMAKNAADYVLVNVESDQPVEYDSIQLTADTSLDLIADAAMQPVSVIRDLNPALLRSMAPAGFQIHVPAGAAQGAQAALESVPAVNRNAWRLHHVESGDTLAAIARSYHLPAQRIAQVNHSTDTLAAGDVLLIPAVYHPEVIKRTSRVRARRVVHSRSGLHSTHVSASRGVAAHSISPRRATRTAG
jgi:membrane-bound lytic murein transglycosylase D